MDAFRYFRDKYNGTSLTFAAQMMTTNHRFPATAWWTGACLASSGWLASHIAGPVTLRIATTCNNPLGYAILFLNMSCGQALKGMGYRLTPQRMMVVEALHGADKHVSAEEIYAQVRARYPYVNISTVYRTLELLKELSLVTEIDLGDGRVRYHPAEKGHHHHLVCQKCSRIIDLPESALDSLKNILLDDYQFKADLKHMAVFGLCFSCKNGG